LVDQRRGEQRVQPAPRRATIAGAAIAITAFVAIYQTERDWAVAHAAISAFRMPNGD
jgi:hypothetical protein